MFFLTQIYNIFAVVHIFFLYLYAHNANDEISLGFGALVVVGFVVGGSVCCSVVSKAVTSGYTIT